MKCKTCSRIRILCPILAFLFVASFTPAIGSLDQNIDALLADPVLKHGVQGVVVESLRDGRVLYERNRNLVFIPASNTKLLVSAAALELLGPDFEFRTSLYRTGPVKEGVLQGDLVLKGAGDPLFDTIGLAALAAEVKTAGIDKIAGRVIGDDSRFDDLRLGEGWRWDNEPFYYSAQVSALNVNKNVVDVYVKPGASAGGRPEVILDPATNYLLVRNEAVTGPAGSEKTLLVDRLRGRNVVRVTGNLPLDYQSNECEELIKVEEPAAFATSLMRDALIKDGVQVTGWSARGFLPEGAVLVASYASPPLKEILSLLNKPSDNLIAEVLLKTLGAELGKAGTTAAGREVEVAFLGRVGVDLSSLAIVDGSGLSRLNYITPGNVITLLRYMNSHKHGETYKNSLPVAGVDGTLRRRMNGTAAEKNVQAKTGYLSRVSALSGYLTTKTGEPLVFSILMNSHLCRNADATAIQNKICELLVSLE